MCSGKEGNCLMEDRNSFNLKTCWIFQKIVYITYVCKLRLHPHTHHTPTHIYTYIQIYYTGDCRHTSFALEIVTRIENGLYVSERARNLWQTSLKERGCWCGEHTICFIVVCSVWCLTTLCCSHWSQKGCATTIPLVNN